MKKLKYVAFGAAAAMASIATFSAAQALTVTVWGGYGQTNPSTGPDGAQNPVPAGPDTASFTWTGPIDWVNNAPNNGTDHTQNLYSQFFTGGAISGYSSGVALSESDFLNTSMSAEGNAWFSYIQVVGTTAAGTASITHDDGASVYQGASALYSWPTQTPAVTGTFAIGAGPFTIDYIEANGSPSDLVFNVASVPEPSTWAMMVLGFAGLAFAGYRRPKGSAAVSAF